MPELPEVETVVRDLRPLVVGRTIRAVRHGPKMLRKQWQADWNPLVAGTRIEAIRRRGKWMVLDLAGAEEPNPPTPFPKKEGGARIGDLLPSLLRGGVASEKEGGARPDSSSPPFLGEGPGEGLLKNLTPSLKRKGKRMTASEGEVVSAPRLIVHLGMTGQFTAVDAANPPADHLHVVFELDQGHELRFRDPRRFGSVTFHADETEVEAFFERNGLGPEPFGLDPAYFRQAVRGTSRTLKAVLLDQQVVAGVGNIYADEACALAGLHPQRQGKSLTPADADRLRRAIETVLTKAIESRGSTIRDYVGGSGLRGGFQNEFRVYGRTGDPCLTCGTAIARVRLSGRSSHFCPSCQPTHHKGTKAAQRTTKKTQEGIR